MKMFILCYPTGDSNTRQTYLTDDDLDNICVALKMHEHLKDKNHSDLISRIDLVQNGYHGDKDNE